MSLRQATQEDATAIAQLHRHVMRSSLPYLPDLHSADEDRAFFADHFLPRHDVWVWDQEGIQGYCGYKSGWLDHLYVGPTFQGQGIGSALLGKAKQANSELNLWVFQRNKPAIAFYEHHGFHLVERTDGQGNEEKEPDARYVWSRGAQ